jgi:hypothetical protein
MTREYQTLIGDGREFVTVVYDIDGEPDDFEIEIKAILCEHVDVMACLLTQQIVDMEMEIIKHHNHLMSGMADL